MTMTEQRFPTPGPIRLEVKVPIADVDVATIDGEESTVTLEGSPRSIEATRVELVGDRLAVEQQRKTFTSWFGRFDGPFRVRVRVPHRSRVSIVGASGDSTLEGTFAAIQTKSASGDVRVSGEVDGDADVKSVSGDVWLPHVGGNLTAQTVSGDIRADSVDGSVSAASVSGNVRVGSLRQGEVTVQSVSGDVALGISPGTGIEVDAGSASGDLFSEIPLYATLGDGAGPSVRIRGKTVSGDFRIFRAA
jgi:DUF4097 and DUF4098 domain-containing protein YvlB